MNALAHHFARDRRKSLTWAVGITMAVLLAAGGAFAGSALAGGSPGGPSGTAATLNAALSTAGSTGSTAGNTTAAKGRRAGLIARLRRLGMYGEVAYRGKDGTTHTLAFERGVVTSDGSALVVKAANGTTWTWQYTSSTVVRKTGSKVSRSDLSSGERVLVAGPVVAGARDARLIVIGGSRHPASGSTPAPAPSAPASSSAATGSVN